MLLMSCATRKYEKSFVGLTLQNTFKKSLLLTQINRDQKRAEWKSVQVRTYLGMICLFGKLSLTGDTSIRCSKEMKKGVPLIEQKMKFRYSSIL
jgi:hypothetical protein